VADEESDSRLEMKLNSFLITGSTDWLDLFHDLETDRNCGVLRAQQVCRSSCSKLHEGRLDALTLEVTTRRTQLGRGAGRFQSPGASKADRLWRRANEIS
jgi:hypothetical protein